MINLLQVVSFDHTVRQTKKGARAPIMMEFTVNPELAPFLVSSMNSVAWVPKASKTGNVRAAVRPRDGFESDVVASVVSFGKDAQWGNVHPLTTEGVELCVEHLEYYELGPLELVVNPDTDLEDVELPEHVNYAEAGWMPVDAVAVVPMDRGFLGTMGVIGQGRIVAVLHNPSRGIAVAWR